MSDNFFAGLENQGSEFEISGGNFEPIPDKTQLLAIIDEAGWIDDIYNEDAAIIQLRWTVMQPEEYKNRKIFQKLRVRNSDPKKSEKAKRMLLAIDANAGGNIAKAGKTPQDADLAIHLMNKPMVIKVMIWEMDGDGDEKRRGNWVCAVSPRKNQNTAPAPVQQASAPVQQASAQLDDDDIPF